MKGKVFYIQIILDALQMVLAQHLTSVVVISDMLVINVNTQHALVYMVTIQTPFVVVMEVVLHQILVIVILIIYSIPISINVFLCVLGRMHPTQLFVLEMVLVPFLTIVLVTLVIMDNDAKLTTAMVQFSILQVYVLLTVRAPLQTSVLVIMALATAGAAKF